MEKFAIDYSDVESALSAPKKYPLESVKNRIEKVAFDVVRFVDSTDTEGLWQIKKMEDGNEYIVAMYDIPEVEKTSGDWHVIVDKSANASVFHKGNIITKIALASIGFAGVDAKFVEEAMVERLNSDSKFVEALMKSVSVIKTADKEDIFPEKEIDRVTVEYIEDNYPKLFKRFGPSVSYWVSQYFNETEDPMNAMWEKDEVGVLDEIFEYIAENVEGLGGVEHKEIEDAARTEETSDAPESVREIVNPHVVTYLGLNPMEHDYLPEDAADVAEHVRWEKSLEEEDEGEAPELIFSPDELEAEELPRLKEEMEEREDLMQDREYMALLRKFNPDDLENN